MSTSVQISILFLEGINARLREAVAAKTPAEFEAQSRSSGVIRAPKWLLHMAHSSAAISLLIVVTAVLCTWR
jgi:hypothetical protein